LRHAIRSIKTASWQTPTGGIMAPALGGRPAIAAAPVSLTEGPIVEEKVYRVHSWGVFTDRQRVRKIRQLAEDYGNDPRLRWFVTTDVLTPAGVAPRDFRGQLAAIFAWVQTNIHYTNESTEQIQAPWWTIKHRTGDCDDMALLLAAMMAAIGHPFKLALAGKQRSTGQFLRWIEGTPFPRGVDFSHIYVFGGDVPLDDQNSTWWAMEPTLRGVPLGYDVTQHGAPAGSGADIGGYAGVGYARQGYAGAFAPSDVPSAVPAGLGSASRPSYGGTPTLLTGAPRAVSATWGALPPATTARAQEVAQLRALPPGEAWASAGPRTFFSDWLDWQRLGSSVLEGTLTALAIGAVLTFGPKWARSARRRP
jgi:predicted transglutaminase-like cysteine proteinase